LENAEDAIVSFGQGCEGEPITEWRLISKSIREIRKQTRKGTINLNTNGSRPERIRKIAESGLDSIRISLNSALSDRYHVYYRPRDYQYEDVVASVGICKAAGLYTMVNYLVFPGVTDRAEELEALCGLIRKTRVDFIHLKNLCIDPPYYIDKMSCFGSPGIGMRRFLEILETEFPDLRLGYFNQPAPWVDDGRV
jgi:MoaA/NifB/PqqE/SkfB family radical SAM enzyme